MATTIYKEGSRGAVVKLIQKAVGCYPDGVWGRLTTESVKAWQKDHGLTADGLAGPKTLAMMGIGAAVGAVTPSQKGYTIKHGDIVLKRSRREIDYIAVHCTASREGQAQTVAAAVFDDAQFALGVLEGLHLEDDGARRGELVDELHGGGGGGLVDEQQRGEGEGGERGEEGVDALRHVRGRRDGEPGDDGAEDGEADGGAAREGVELGERVVEREGAAARGGGAEGDEEELPGADGGLQMPEDRASRTTDSGDDSQKKRAFSPMRRIRSAKWAASTVLPLSRVPLTRAGMPK